MYSPKHQETLRAKSLPPSGQDALPAAKPAYVQDVSVSELLGLADPEFVEETYRRILGREPDPLGRQWLSSRISGYPARRVVMLARIRYAREGRLRNVHVRGLWLALLSYAVLYFPVIGYGLRLAFSAARLPVTWRKLQWELREQQSAGRQQQRILDLLQQLNESLWRELRQVNEKAESRALTVSANQAHLVERVSAIEARVSADHQQLVEQVSAIEARVSANHRQLVEQVNAILERMDHLHALHDQALQRVTSQFEHDLRGMRKAEQPELTQARRDAQSTVDSIRHTRPHDNKRS